MHYFRFRTDESKTIKRNEFSTLLSIPRTAPNDDKLCHFSKRKAFGLAHPLVFFRVPLINRLRPGGIRNPLENVTDRRSVSRRNGGSRACTICTRGRQHYVIVGRAATVRCLRHFWSSAVGKPSPLLTSRRYSIRLSRLAQLARPNGGPPPLHAPRSCCSCSDCSITMVVDAGNRSRRSAAHRTPRRKLVVIRLLLPTGCIKYSLLLPTTNECKAARWVAAVCRRLPVRCTRAMVLRYMKATKKCHRQKKSNRRQCAHRLFIHSHATR